MDYSQKRNKGVVVGIAFHIKCSHKNGDKKHSGVSVSMNPHKIYET